MLSTSYLDATVFCATKDPKAKKVTYRFSFIHRSEEKLQKFERMAIKFPRAWYVNYYWRHLPEGQNFAFRRYLVDKRPE